MVPLASATGPIAIAVTVAGALALLAYLFKLEDEVEQQEDDAER